MRTLSTQETKVLAAPAQSVATRVSVKDAAGSWVNLSSLYGYDWVRSVSYESVVDSPFATASVELVREQYALSLASMMTASRANAGGSLIELRRELKVETATLPEGLVADGSTTWRTVFYGVIDDIDAASPSLVLKATDLGVKLQDAFIEEERVYGRWAALRTIRVGTVVKRSTDPLQGTTGVQAWRCTTAGTTGATEPSWPSSPSSGTTQTDGTVTWTYQAAAAWSSSSARSAGAIVKETARPLRYWTCTSGGTTGGTEPSWPSSPTQGQTQTDGTVTWAYTAGLYGTPVEVVMQSIIDDTFGASAAPYLRGMEVDANTVALWRHDETSGATVADAAGLHPLTSSSSSNIVAGKIGNARDHNGSSGRQEQSTGSFLNSTESTNFASGTWTVEALVNPAAYAASNSYGCILQFTDSITYGSGVVTGGVFLEKTAGSLYMTEWSGSAGYIRQTTTPISSSTWHHLAYVVDHPAGVRRVRFLLDGVALNSVTGGSSGASPTTGMFVIGNDPPYSEQFSGLIDEIRVSNVARSDAEIAASYARCFTPYVPPSTTPTVVCPVSPGWYLGEFRQQRTTVWEALQALSRQLGWDLRYVWSESDGAFVLRLSSIDRAPSSVVASLSPDRYLDVRRASRAVDAIRNAVQVVWWDAEDVDAVTSAPKQKRTVVTDSASVTAYGRRWMEVAEASASAIATAALASQFAAAMLSDLAQPVFDHELELLYAWHLELNDYVRCLANGRTYDLDQDLAVVGLRHRLDQGGQRTSLQMRGKPTAGVARYHDVAVAPRNAPAPRTLAPTVPAEVTITPHAIGAQVVWQQPSGRILPPGTTVEAHLSTSSGFTPGPSTYRGDIAGGRLELSGLTAGTTYYLRTAYRSREGNLSDYSTQQSLTPTKVASTDVDGLSNYAVKARPSADATYVADSPIALGTEDWDVGGCFASSILTVPSGAAGKWRIEARIHVTGAQAGDRISAYANKNSGTKADIAPWSMAVEGASGSIELFSDLVCELDLAVGDTIQLGSRFTGGSTSKTVKAPTSTVAGTTLTARRMGA